MRMLQLMGFLGVVVLTAGCGPLISPFINPSVKVNEQGLMQEPLKVSQQKARAIKKIAVPNAAVYSKSDDDKRLYKVQLDVLIEELKKSGRFNVISPRQFQRKADELNLLQDIYTMNMEELKVEAARVAQVLGCDAVLALGSKQQKVAMGGAVAQGVFIGSVSVPFVSTLDLISSRTAESIWYQEYEGKFTAGQMGIKNTPDDELRSMLTPVMQPLVADFLHSFSTL